MHILFGILLFAFCLHSCTDNTLICLIVLLVWMILLHTSFFKEHRLFLLLIPVCLYASLEDLRIQEIPDVCWIFTAAYSLLTCRTEHLCFVSVLLAAGILLSLSGALGFGDVKFFCAFALSAGTLVFMSLFLASFTALVCTAVKKESVQRRIPFAPFLSFGFLLTALLL